MECKYCGQEFEPNKYGRKRDYCNQEECIRKAKNDANKKWYANKLKVLEGTRNRIIEQKEEKKVVYSSTDRAINSFENEDFSEVIEIARELGAIRFKIEETIKKCTPDQSICDKEDQVFLHNFEELAKKEEVYEDEIIELFKMQIDKRQKRRGIKDKVELLQRLLQGIIKNPNAYVTNFIKNRDKRTYNANIKEKEAN